MALGCLAIFLAPLVLVKSFTSQVVVGFNLGFFEVFDGLTVSQQLEPTTSSPGSECLLEHL